MTLVNSQHSRLPRSAATNRSAFMRLIRRVRAVLKTIHLTIAAAKIHRLRNELMLHSDSYDRWVHPDAADGGAELSGPKFPQRPMVLGDKWDF